MKTRNLNVTIVVMALAAMAAFGQEGAIGNRAQLRVALATAKTAADHAKIAMYYHRAALTYTQKQTEEEAIAEQWHGQYGSWMKSPNPYQSAKALASYYGQLASDAMTHAREQDKLAAL